MRFIGLGQNRDEHSRRLFAFVPTGYIFADGIYFVGTPMNCPKCDAENPFDAMVCVSCHEPLPPVDEEDAPQRHSKVLLAGLIILVVVVVIAAVLALIY